MELFICSQSDCKMADFKEMTFAEETYPVVLSSSTHPVPLIPVNNMK